MEGISHSQEESKEQQWQNERAIVDTLVDGLGLPIDEKIKECVVALHLSGIDTSGSHEGKLNKYPAPYIDVQSTEALRLTEELVSIQDKQTSDEEKSIRQEMYSLYDSLASIKNKESEEASRINTEIGHLYKKLEELPEGDSTETAPLKEKITIENLAERQKLIDLVHLFNITRNTEDENRLIVQPLGLGISRLTNKGADIQENETDTKKIEERLHAFQAEMDAFTEFLKNRFLGR
ncbi:MAG TPA: hypothetical protein PK950_02275 [Candidatus Paceibacterota bacterium]|nr:hypothetical protein [Candidatus Paceibacterota bacterium]